MIIILAHYHQEESAPIGIAGSQGEAAEIANEWLDSQDPDNDPMPYRIALYHRGPRGAWVQCSELEV